MSKVYKLPGIRSCRLVFCLFDKTKIGGGKVLGGEVNKSQSTVSQLLVGRQWSLVGIWRIFCHFCSTATLMQLHLVVGQCT